MLAPRLRPEPELDQRRGRGRDDDAGRRHQRIARRGSAIAAMNGANMSATLPITASILARMIQPAGSARSRPGPARPRPRSRARRGRRPAGLPPSPAPAPAHDVAALAAEGAPQHQAGRQQIQQLHQRLRGQPRVALAAASIPFAAARPSARWRETAAAGAGSPRHRRCRPPPWHARRSAPRTSRSPARAASAGPEHGRERGGVAEHRARRPPDQASTAGTRDTAIRSRNVNRTACRRRGLPRSAGRYEVAPITAATICAASRVRFGPMVRNSATVSATAKRRPRWRPGTRRPHRP